MTNNSALDVEEVMVKEAKLLPCPFCAGKEAETSSNGMESHFVYCCECGAEGPGCVTEVSAILRWNARASKPLPVEAIVYAIESIQARNIVSDGELWHGDRCIAALRALIEGAKP